MSSSTFALVRLALRTVASVKLETDVISHK